MQLHAKNREKSKPSAKSKPAARLVKEMDYFFKPKSIAVIGASRSPKKFGHIILQNLLKSFTGSVYPVNPEADEILGKKCYKGILAVPGSVDLAVVVIPSQAVPDVVKNCAKKGVKACVIISAGFSEIGRPDLEKKILESRGNMRIIGPNVIGIFDSHNHIDIIFNPVHRQERPPQGSISFISQSGAFGAAMMDWSSHEGIGLSKFISIGNRIDVDEVDVLEYLSKDNKTGVISLYLEGTKRGRELFKIMKTIAKKKPIVALKAGRTSAGSAAVSSHTGSLAGAAEIYSGMFKQAGVIEARSIDELFGFSKALAYQPLPKGERVAVITNGGGFGVLCADAVIENGLKLAKLSEKTIATVKRCVPNYVTVANPMDLTGDADSKRYEVAVRNAMSDSGVDGIIVTLLLQISALESDIIDVLQKFRNKPLLVCSTGGEFTNIHRKMLESQGIPTYQTPESAVKAMKALVEYSRQH